MKTNIDRTLVVKNIITTNTNLRDIKFFIAAILFLGISVSSWGTTIASWGKISISASTDYTASGGAASGVASFSSSKDMTQAGTYGYYGSSAAGAIITFSNLSLSSYRNIKISFYSKASSGRTWSVQYSPNGTNWYNYTGPNTNAMTGTETLYTIEGIPPTATHIKLTHLGTTGSLYFGTITISGDGDGECTDGMLAKGVAAGDEIVIYDENDSKEWDGLSSGYGGGSVFTTKPDGDYTFIVEAGSTANTTYSLKHGTQYLSMSSEASNTLTLSDTKNAASSWTISIDNNGVAKICNCSYTDYYIKFNKNNSRFTGYTANATNTRYPRIAHYCPSEYHVTYNDNGATSGSVPVDNTGYDPAGTDQAIVLGNTGSLVKTGYGFGGWNTNTTGTGSNYTAGDQFYVTDNITLYAKWTANQYTITLNNQDADSGKGGTGSISVTYDASTNLTSTPAITVPQKTGYTFGGYYTGEGGAGTQIIAANGNVNASAGGGSTYTNASTQWKYADDITLYAKWTQTVDLLKNTGTSDGSVTVTYNAGTSSFSEVSKTGWTCTGYWTTSSGGYKVIEADGSLAEYSSNISAYINSDGKWIHTGATELYAQWEANLYTVTFYKNDISATGSMDAQLFTYGTAQNLSTCTFEKTGYSFAGWATTSSGDKVYDDGEEVNNLTNTPDGNVDLFALWSINSYTLTVGTPDNVTITAEPDGGSEMEEGDDDDVEYNTTITLAYTGMTSGYFWGGWRVTDGSGNDITEDVMYDENTMFMPASNATVTALLYTNAKAWCPVITLELSDGLTPILVTSVGGQSVKAVRTLHLTVTGAPADASRIEIRGNDLEFYDGTTKITDSNLKCSSKSLDKTITVAYAPSAYVDESWANPTITVECYTAASGGTIAASIDVDDLVNARCLPDNGTGSSQGFVIAAKVGDEWLALPNSMSAGTQYGLPIVVNSTSDPSVATMAPSTARYNLYNVYATSGVKDRFKANGTYVYLAGDGTKALKSAASGANISLGVSVTPGTYDGSAADPAYIEWLLSTTDKKNYTLTNNGRSLDPDVSNDLKYYTTQDKFGMYAYNSHVITEFRLLPATFYTAISAEVTEWGKKSVILDVDAQSIAGVQAHFGDRAEAEKATSFGQTKTSVKNADSKYNYTLTFSTLDFSTHKGEVVYFDWLDGDDNVVSTSLINIPWIIATSGTMSSIEDTKEEWNTEVHVLPGVTLTADGGSFDDAVEIEQLEIYPGATVNVTTGTLTATNLMLRNGWTRAGDKEYDVARLFITPTTGSLIAMHAYADWYIDYDQYYPVAVPWDVTVSGIRYANTASVPTVGPSGQVRLRYYDGNSRATNVQEGVGNGANWKEYGAGGCTAVPETLNPSKAYAMTAKRPTGKAFSIIRMPLTIPSASWTASGEQGEVGGTHKDQVTVTAYGVKDKSETAYAEGWNFIANPYMALYKGAITLTPEEGDATTINVVNIPDVDFKEYGQYATATTQLKPSSGFLIQTPATGTITFGTANRQVSAPSYRREVREEMRPEQQAYILLSNESAEDMMGIFVSEKYTAGYDLNGDVEKFLSDGTTLRTYMHYGEMKLAYVALTETLAQEWIPVTVRIPSTGEYTFSIHEASKVSELEGVYLIDYANGDRITNLIEENYIFEAEAGTIEGRFAINAKVGEHKVPTDIDIVNVGGDLKSEAPFKFIYNDKAYIYHRGVIYDAMGKRVREINK